MQPEPYFGVTGFMTRQEVAAVNAMLPPTNVGLGDFRFMQGILMSSKTLRGLSNKYPNKYPKREDIPNLFSNYRDTMNIIHYNTDDVEDLPLQLMAMAGMYAIGERQDCLHGFQLNIAWPRVELLDDFLKMSAVACNDNWEIILQVGQKALDQVSGSPTALAAKLKEYEPFVDYVLLDPSGGFGKPMDLKQMREYVDAIYDTGHEFGLGIAGGLSGEALRGEVAGLIQDFVYLSIDAEGRLRDENDNLDLVKVKSYVDMAVGLYTMNFK